MTHARVQGLERLQRRLAARGLGTAMRAKLRAEATAVAAGAAEAAPGRLGATIEVREESKGPRIAFSVGSAHRAARFVEFGTRIMAARPFLWPVFRRRLPRIKHELTNTFRAYAAK